MVGNVGLWLGIETFLWTVDQFKEAADFCRAHQIDTCFIKVAEGNVEWYSSKFATYIAPFTGLKIIPYGYFYGNRFGSLQSEINLITRLIAKYGVLCLDLETEWEGQVSWAQQLAPALSGEIYVSTFANMADHGLKPVMAALQGKVAGWIPQVYSDYLASVWSAQWEGIAPGSILPAIHLGQEFPPNNPAAIATGLSGAISLWEYQIAVENPGLADQIIKRRNVNVEIADFVNISQFEPNETQFACGPFCVGLLRYMGAPGKGASGTAELVDLWSDAEYVKYVGPNVPSDVNGVSTDDMHKMLIDAGLHYQDITAINSSSGQASDLTVIKAALQSGYPVVATITEMSIVDLDLGANPYAWGPTGTHIIIYSGISADGNFLVRDPANIEGTPGGKNTLRPGPRRYDASRIANQWAAWIIPDWKEAPMPDYFAQEMQDEWNSTKILCGGTSPHYDSGIALAWQAKRKKGKFPGPPINQEYHTVSAQGKAVVAQIFSNWRCEWIDGKDYWYDANGFVE